MKPTTATDNRPSPALLLIRAHRAPFRIRSSVLSHILTLLMVNLLSSSAVGIAVSPHGGKRGWRQQLAADALDELAILLGLGDHLGPFGIGEKSVPALLALGHAVPGKHVDDLLAALADQRGPEPGLADAVLLPDPQRLVLEPRQQRRLAPRHAAIDPQFVDHGPSPQISVVSTA